MAQDFLCSFRPHRQNEPCSEASVKFRLESAEKLNILFSFGCSIGLPVLISTVSEKGALFSSSHEDCFRIDREA